MRATTLILPLLLLTNLSFAGAGSGNGEAEQLDCLSEATEYYQEFTQQLGNFVMDYARLKPVKNINLEEFAELSGNQKHEIGRLQSNSIIFTGWSYQSSNGSSIEPDSDRHLILVNKKNCHRVKIYHYQTDPGVAG